ncbi:RagB/SusD family nutrient uptake outer membrane protein [Aequorivita sp. F47161]|uniref:RagB/SusD family nutrient uptake outer membrane protein n=1 Tax=Aequorivita vitellina TaxID=2874475 RepID=A0A9X1QW31_9FLAO|nr:RagB/SusD family nutrient uptake outer membrane protein [Aequorivita vitellina]MCG2419385.1 RagB/SusD family nutrient uptake outer membrane protein [Aequorivita vitellina]
MKTILNFLNRLAYLAIVSITALSFIGCEKDLEVGLPNSQLTGISVFQNVATARAALAKIYADIRDTPPLTGTSEGLNLLIGLYADEMKYYGEGGSSIEAFYKHNIQSNSSLTEGFWSGGYQAIYQCNSVLEGLATAPITGEEKAPLEGEALFLRAYLHFYLLNLYGDIPFINTTDYLVNASVKRQPQEEVYTAIIADLEQANELLPNTDQSGQYIYATKAAANALLARIYLYREQWQKSLDAATTVLEDSPHTFTDDLSQVFVSTGPGIIWQLPPITSLTTSEAFTFIFETAPPPLAALQPELIESFEPNDARLSQWIGVVTDGTQNWYYPYKYKTRIAGDGPEEFSVLMRLAEVFLIRAEARVHLGDIGGAQSDLNKIRHRADLEDSTASTETELITAILEERRHELFTEQGHRWFDLKRTGNAAEVLQPLKPNWRITDLLFPLPQQELRLNPNLQPQNPGY